MTDFSINQIGVIHSPYKEKFAVPRQPGLVADGCGELELLAPYNEVEAVRGLTEFSHIWVVFIFHQTADAGWRPTVRPPRLGGNTRMGVFATRSTFRPNPIGMSLIELKGVRCDKGRVFLQLGSLDLVDGTPVIDIKPYLPFAENISDAKGGFAPDAPHSDMQVCFSELAQKQIEQQEAHYPQLARFIGDVLSQDPRPAYKKSQSDAEESREYAVWLLDFNVRWQVKGAKTTVLSVDPR